MAIKSIKEMPKSGKLEIDTTGPDGNAFALMAYARMIAKQLKINHEPIINEMMDGDYEHLIEVMEKHFGDYIILYR
jgi:hypothetical protein